MSELRALLERKQRELHAPPGSFDRLIRRRDRRRRNQRIAAGSVGIAVFVAAVWVVTSGGPFDRAPEPIGPERTETAPAPTEPALAGPRDAWHVTDKDIALGESLIDAWVAGDGEAAAAMFDPEGTFDGFQPAILPALHDWFRAGGWTFRSGGCGRQVDTSWEDDLGLGYVGCGFTYENDLTRALEMDPVEGGLAVFIDGGRIETASTTDGGGLDNMFRSPGAERWDRFGAVWDMFIDWMSSRDPNEFVRMYDPDRDYPLLDPRSIELWKRNTDEFVASPEAARRTFTEWMGDQTFGSQARRICMSATDRFFATAKADDLRGDAAYYTTLAEISEETLAELQAIPLGTEDDRATMDAYIPLAQRMIELHRQQAEATAAGDRARLDELAVQRIDLNHSLHMLIEGCPVDGEMLLQLYRS